MKRLYQLLALAVLVVGAPPAAFAQTDTQDVTIIVEDINEIAISGNVTLTINSATGGGDPDDATDATTSYDLTTNGSGKKITGILDGEYETGISLSITLAAPAASGTSAGAQTLNMLTAVDLVTAIANVSEVGLGISYTASATSAAVPNGVAGETQTVTFTVTDV